MKRLLKYSEWQDSFGNWYCNDVSDPAGIAGLWWTPARMLGISPVDFVALLIDRFAPDYIHYNEEKDVLTYSWRSITAQRKFKNWLNAEVRKHQFYI